MLYAKDFREKARNALNGNWGTAIGTGLLAAFLGGSTVTENLNFSDSLTNENTLNQLSIEMLSILLVFTLIISLVIFVSAVIKFIIGGVITLGYAKFNLNLIDGKKAQVSDLFSQFQYFGNAFLMQLLRMIFIFLWMLLFIIPGIIASYSYAMTPYILYENPEMSANDAIKASKELMDGNKGRLFCLELSFIGWHLLAVFTFGIGYLWLIPYQEAAYAAFYREIKHGTYTYSDTYSSEQNNYNF